MQTDQLASRPDSTEPTGDPDVDLVARARRGDMGAFDELVRKHFQRIFGLAYHMMGHREDAEDVTQAIFIKAHRAIDRFRGQSAFSSWLHRIAINETLNAIKRRKRGPKISLADLQIDSPEDPAYIRMVSSDSPARAAHLKELQTKLNEALQTLSHNHRTVVVLHDVQGVPHDQIAEMLGCSVGTVRSRLFYARRLLQVEMNEFAP